MNIEVFVRGGALWGETDSKGRYTSTVRQELHKKNHLKSGGTFYDSIDRLYHSNCIGVHAASRQNVTNHSLTGYWGAASHGKPGGDQRMDWKRTEFRMENSSIIYILSWVFWNHVGCRHVWRIGQPPN